MAQALMSRTAQGSDAPDFGTAARETDWAAGPLSHKGRVRHPGLPKVTSVEAVETDIVPIAGTLRPGHSVMAEVERIFAEAGCRGGVASLQGGDCQPFRYVGPALSRDSDHAVWYSDVVAPAHGARILSATVIVGRRDGATFLHCHGTWETGGKTPKAGHMLTSDSIVREPIALTAFGSRTAWFESLPDAETNFTLFTPRSTEAGRGSLLLRIRPHEDLCCAIEDECRRHGLSDARIYGIGSLIGSTFENSEGLSCAVTEIDVERGTLTDGVAALDLAAVDVDGTIRRGRISRGDNPVCVTFELLVVGPGEGLHA